MQTLKQFATALAWSFIVILLALTLFAMPNGPRLTIGMDCHKVTPMFGWSCH